MDILSQLKELRLHGMGRSWKVLSQSRKHHKLTLTEGTELLLQAELTDRDTNALTGSGPMPTSDIRLLLKNLT